MNEPAPVDVCDVTDCDRPSDGYYLCNLHAEDLRKTAETLSWLLSELDLVMSLQTRYTSASDRGGSTSAPLDFVAAKTRRVLLGSALNLAATVAKANGWTEPTTAPAAATFIVWRLTAVRLSPDAGPLATQLFAATRSAVYVIDRPVSRQYLGDCETLQPKETPCPGRVYGREWRTWAACDTCGLRWDQRQLRDYLIAQLTDRLCTAAEIAHLSTYLGLTLTRDQARKRLNQWHRRGTLPAMGHRDGAPVFRFGTAEILLARYAQDNG